MSETLSFAEEQAFQLSEAAIALDKARADGPDKFMLASALEQNLETWVAMKALFSNESCVVPSQAKENIIRLANFVAARTFRGIDTIDDTAIDSFVNINLQIAEGLLEGAHRC